MVGGIAENGPDGGDPDQRGNSNVASSSGAVPARGKAKKKKARRGTSTRSAEAKTRREIRREQVEGERLCTCSRPPWEPHAPGCNQGGQAEAQAEAQMVATGGGPLPPPVILSEAAMQERLRAEREDLQAASEAMESRAAKEHRSRITSSECEARCELVYSSSGSGRWDRKDQSHPQQQPPLQQPTQLDNGEAQLRSMQFLKMSGEKIPVPEDLGSLRKAREVAAQSMNLHPACVNSITTDGLTLGSAGPIPDGCTQIRSLLTIS